MATFLVGGKNAHTRVNLRHIAQTLTPQNLQNNPTAVESTLRALVKANPVLRNQTSYLAGHYLNLPAGYLNPGQQSIYDLMNNILKSWGLSSLGGDLKKLIVQGDSSPDTLSLALSQTDAYKKRFAGNAARVANGLPELDPATYVATEEQYRNLLRSYGTPAGFYDQPTDFNKMIGNDVSPAELEQNLKDGFQQYESASPAAKQIWQKYFGLSAGDIVAHLIDPTRYSVTDLQNKAAQAQIGGAAAEQGFKLGLSRAQQFQEQGVTLDQARQAYANISSDFGVDKSIARRFGTTLDQTQEENARLLNQGADVNKLQQLYSSETNLFKGHGAANADTLAPNLSNNL